MVLVKPEINNLIVIRIMVMVKSQLYISCFYLILKSIIFYIHDAYTYKPYKHGTTFSLCTSFSSHSGKL